MAKEVKTSFLGELTRRYGGVRKLERSQSLYEIGGGAARIYIRYSKLHSRRETFYGLRREDLRQLEGYPSLLCFLWEGQNEPLLVPFSEFEDVFRSMEPAPDGQYKVLIYLGAGTELYIAGAGRFNVEAYFGWEQLESVLDSAKLTRSPDLSHFQIQTLLGAIGIAKGYDIWVPQNDRAKLDWTLTGRFECRDTVPYGFEPVLNILREVDTIWIERGSSNLLALFEVEHSTPIYSGLLRFNDIHLLSMLTSSDGTAASGHEEQSVYVRS